MSFPYDERSKMIDHALLNPTLNGAVLITGIRLARAYIESKTFRTHTLKVLFIT
ncbi:MAG: hypothetical protein P1S60_17245 [Anaerolineae bacterium]|nr:hypothetical protein [Anaerolineae bacterium]